MRHRKRPSIRATHRALVVGDFAAEHAALASEVDDLRRALEKEKAATSELRDVICDAAAIQLELVSRVKAGHRPTAEEVAELAFRAHELMRAGSEH